MPTYDYQCRLCGSVTEVIHSMLEDGPTTCERCGGELRRVLYPAGIIFKGSGFYRTDSRRDASASGASRSSDGAAAGSGSTKADGTAGGGTGGDGAAPSGGDTKGGAETKKGRSPEAASEA